MPNWWDITWSPVTGCTPVSRGCKNCYAKREVETRWSKNPRSVFFGREFADVLTHKEALAWPLRYRGAKAAREEGRPTRVFVGPRGDLFHDAVPAPFLDSVFAAMAMS